MKRIQASPTNLGLPLLVGLVIRELIAPWTGHPFDFEIWVRLGVYMQSMHNPYALLPFVPGLSFTPIPLITSISYPPLSAFLFGATYWLYQALGSPSQFLYYFLLKQPMVLSDVLVAVLLFRVLSIDGHPEVARRAALIWLFLPLTIIVSSVWGALDSVALLLVLGSVYFVQTRRPSASAALLGLAIFLKLMPVIFLVPLLMYQKQPWRASLLYATIAVVIPVLGTLVPIYALGWGFSGITSAVSYQGSLPGFGGMGIFNVLSLISPRDAPLSTALSMVWVPALLLAYAVVYLRKSGLYESLLVTVLTFSVFRPVMPEQWALYPVALLLLMPALENRARLLGIASIATAYLLVNNLLLVRFFAPSFPAAFAWDQFMDNASAFADVRYALLLVVSILFTTEALWTVLRKRPFLASKFESLGQVRWRSVVSPLAYLGVVSLTGGLLDFTATSMITNWSLAIQSDIFLGLSWLSLYHIMLVLVFEAMTVFIAVYSRRGLSGSLRLFLLLTFLNVAASGVSLILYRSLDSQPLLAQTAIYLVSSLYVSERGFVIFTVTLSALGIFYLDELKQLLLMVGRIPQIARPTLRLRDANSLPATP